VVPALITPFTDDDRVDEDSLRRAVAFQRDAGAHGLLINGLAGEGIFLSIQERERVTEVVAEAASGLPLLVGCTADSTEDACRLARGARERGASAVMVAPPRRPDWTREQFKSHYREVASSAGCEVMVQDAPFAIGVELGAELVLELADELPEIRSYKIEALPYWSNAVRAREVAGDRLAVFGGHGGVHLMDVLDAGSAGLIPGADVTATLVKAWTAYRHGDRGAAAQTFTRVLPLLVYQAQSLGLLVGGAKAVLHERGVIAGEGARLPEARLNAASRERMLQLARACGELSEA
jgi:4-hydroxy-tetrahydrodipicolinate synthase